MLLFIVGVFFYCWFLLFLVLLMLLLLILLLLILLLLMMILLLLSKCFPKSSSFLTFFLNKSQIQRPHPEPLVNNGCHEWISQILFTIVRVVFAE